MAKTFSEIVIDNIPVEQLGLAGQISEAAALLQVFLASNFPCIHERRAIVRIVLQAIEMKISGSTHDERISASALALVAEMKILAAHHTGQDTAPSLGEATTKGGNSLVN